MIRLNTRLQFTLLFLIAFIGLTIVLGSIIYVSLKNHMYNDFHKLLEKRAHIVAGTELKINNYSLDDLKLFEITDKIKDPKDYILQKNQTNDFSIWSKQLTIPISFFKKIETEKKGYYRKGNTLYSGVLYTNNNQNYYVVSLANNYFEGKLIGYLEETLFIAIGICILIALILSFFISKHLYSPIKNITRKVEQIRTENLHLRLDEERKNDEINHLIRTFNDMLDRLETSFETQKNFISNASHELRTPLTGIIGTADVCLSKIRSYEEYTETLGIILEEAYKLDRKTQVLLSLAQTGFNGKVQKFEKVRIDQLLWDAKESIEKLNQKNKIHFDTSLLPENSLKLKVIGNSQLLLLAFTNIINNACKYSDHKVVNLSIGASSDKIFTIIRDSGIGIPREEMNFIYDLFFRASNTKNYEGYGIGLPLTRNIVKMHNGEILVNSIENVGTTVQIILPIANLENP